MPEAISMSDKVIVMSSRPGKIKKIYDIELTNKSTPLKIEKQKSFLNTMIRYGRI